MSLAWNSSYAASREAELALLAYLQGRYPDAERAPEDQALSWDLRVPSQDLVIEVKVDRIAGVRSDHVAIETAYRGRPSGISSTQANWWAIFIHGRAHVVPVEQLKAAIVGCKTVPGGDMKSSTLALLPLKTLRGMAFIFPPFTKAAA